MAAKFSKSSQEVLVALEKEFDRLNTKLNLSLSKLQTSSQRRRVEIEQEEFCEKIKQMMETMIVGRPGGKGRKQVRPHHFGE